MNYKLAVEAWLGGAQQPKHRVASMLEGLRPALEQLRNGYQANTVEVPYGGKIAEAYLLAYVPPYIHQAESVLRQAVLNIDLAASDELQVGLLCPGPGPELIGLVRSLKALKQHPKLRVTYFDIANDGWAITRRGLLRCADEIYPRFTSSTKVDIDLRSRLGPADLAQFADFDLVMAQNMANEVVASQQARQNLVNVFRALKPGALAVLSDQRQYGAAEQLEAGLTRRLRPHFAIHHDAMPSSSRQPLCPHFSRPNHPLLDNYFFSDRDDKKLKPRVRMNVVEWIGVKRSERRSPQ